MFMLDMPNIPPQAPVVIVAQNSEDQRAVAQQRTVGICRVVGNATEPLSGDYALSFEAAAGSYLFVFEKDKRSFDENTAKITFLQLPQHGKVINEIGDTTEIFKGGNYYSYIPNTGYSGKDKIIAMVEIGGYKVKAVYFLHVVNDSFGEPYTDKYCKQPYWKISTQSEKRFSFRHYALPARTQPATLSWLSPLHRMHSLQPDVR